MNLMRPFFLLILFLSAALPAAGAQSKFTIEPVGGKVTASWKGTADTSGIDLAPTDDEIAALAAHKEIEAIRISGTTRLTGKGFAALKGLSKLRELSFGGTGPGQFSEMFPPGSLEGYHALAELDQVTRLNLDHVMLPVEGAVILLKGMAGLEHAGLGVFADDKIVAAAADSPKLKTLAFGHWATVPESPLTKAGAQAFAKLRSLESLHAGEQAPPAGANLADDKWHHAAYVWHSEPRQQRLFIDGQLIATNAGPGGNTGLTGTITLGRSNSGGSFKDGSLDEFRVSSRRLAAEEISQLSKWRR